MRNAVLKTPARPIAGRAPAFFHKKRLRAMTIAAAALLLAAVAAVTILQQRGGGAKLHAAATVNGEPIAMEELQQAMTAQKAKIAAYFKSKYDADSGPDFWTASFDGEVPAEKLKKDALAQVVQLKLQQAMAKHEGLTEDITYASFLKELKAENKRRAHGGDDQPGVYGPKQYSESAYYSLVNSNLIGELKKKLGGSMTWTDAQLRAFYDEQAADQFTSRDSVRADTVSVAYGDGASFTDSEAEAAAKKIAEQLDAGMSASAAAKAFEGTAAVKTVMLDAETARAASLETPLLLSSVQNLRPGQHTGIFKENGAYVLALVTAREQSKAYAFEDVKEGIAAQLADEAYDAIVAKAVADAKVVIDRDVYDRMDPEAQ